MIDKKETKKTVDIKNKTNLKIEEKIKDIIDSVRFYINQDGGDIEYVSYDNQKKEVSLRLLGACIGCSMIDLTYKDGLETILKSEIKEIKSIKLLI